MKLKFFILTMLSLASISAAADVVTLGHLKFTTNTNGTASVSGFVDEPIEITIPQTITVDSVDYNVTTIGSSAFKNCTSLEKIIIPEYITSVGTYAFNGCTKLRTLFIDESTSTLSLSYHTYINYQYGGSGKGQFYDCPLDTIYIGRQLSHQTASDYGSSPFRGIKGPKSLVSTKKSYEYFEIIEIQSVVKKFGVNGFDFIFAVRIRPL